MNGTRRHHEFTYEEVKWAAKVIERCGMSIEVPCGPAPVNPHAAALYATARDLYDTYMTAIAQRAALQRVEKKAREIGAPLDEYLHYLKYADPYLYSQTGAKDVEMWGGRCMGTNSRDKQCRMTVSFHKDFKSFRPGIHDRCPWHRRRKRRRARMDTATIRSRQD